MVLIHEKISALLEQRRLKKRDLARALGVSPQTATDICKGRSAITLPHLRNLVSFFELRADYWLDEARLHPEPTDALGMPRSDGLLARTGLLLARDPERLVRAMLDFARQHRAEFASRNPDLATDDARVLGMSDPGDGGSGLGTMTAARE